MPTYLDCAATTPIDPRVRDIVVRYMDTEFGNSGSRTHEFGVRARRAVEKARDQVAAVVGATRGEVVFTSGGTESNNLAILGLAEYGLRAGRKHLVSTAIEHHAVLEPLRWLEQRGFELTLVPPDRTGRVEPGAVRDAVRDDTLLVSVMHVNNETGVIQPVGAIAGLLAGHRAYFHVDAAQGYGKELASLRGPRIDLISVSGHKIHAPKGIGALIARRREIGQSSGHKGQGERPPLTPLMYGGGQELGLRPGTLPVHLIAGLGLAAELCVTEAGFRTEANRRFRDVLLAALRPLGAVLAADPEHTVANIVNLSFPGLDAEDVIEALADIVAISNGAACTSQSQTCSHVLSAMRLTSGQIQGALRFSWCHVTEEVDWGTVARAIPRGSGTLPLKSTAAGSRSHMDS
jgi:cysteine desulfurase